jgi:hypothetical protein
MKYDGIRSVQLLEVVMRANKVIVYYWPKFPGKVIMKNQDKHYYNILALKIFLKLNDGKILWAVIS